MGKRFSKLYEERRANQNAQKPFTLREEVINGQKVQVKVYSCIEPVKEKIQFENSILFTKLFTNGSKKAAAL